MASPITHGDFLGLAFRLAFFIHARRETAQLITLAAMENLETATQSQDKRIYYVGMVRTKISFTELHLLQSLVYEKSEFFEQQRERDAASPLGQERYLVHFIKHLVWISGRRNSRAVVVGLTRLLHQYTTEEAMGLYDLILQDPDRASAADFFRSRKKVLMDELLERFGQALTIVRGARGAQRFALHDQPARFAALVNDCLSAFVPWQTRCSLPERFDPTEVELPELRFNSLDLDEEHAVEIRRYHALLHPECFARLLRSLGYVSSVERLEIPRFAQAAVRNEDDPDKPDGNAELTGEECEELLRSLREREQRRKTASARVLRFVANGAEVARLDLDQGGQVRFQLPRYAEFLEFRDADDLLLATHRLSYDDNDQLRPQNATIVLQNRQRFAFNVVPPAIEIVAHQTNWLRGLVKHWRDWWTAAVAPQPVLPALVPLAALLLVLSPALGVLWYREREASRVVRQTLAQFEARQQQAEANLTKLEQERRAAQTQLQAFEQARRDAEARAQQLQTQLDAKPKPPAALALTNLYVEQRRLANLKSGGDSEPIVVPTAAQTIVLLLEISNPLSYSTYTIEIRDNAGNLLGTLTGLNPRLTRDNRLSLTLARAALQAGVYQLRLLGQRGAEKTDLGEYVLRFQFN